MGYVTCTSISYLYWYCYPPEQIQMLDSDPQKSQIPLIISSTGLHLWIFLDSKHWCQTFSKTPLSRDTVKFSSSSTTMGQSLHPAPPSMLCPTTSVEPTAIYEDDTNKEEELMHSQINSTNPPSGLQPMRSTSSSSLCLHDDVQARKCHWEWSEYSEIPNPHHPQPHSTTRTSCGGYTNARLNRQYQPLEQVPEDGTIWRPNAPIDTHFRGMKPTTITCCTPQVTMWNPTSTSSNMHSSNNHLQHNDHIPRLPCPSAPPPGYQHESDHKGSTLQLQHLNPLTSCSIPAREYEQWMQHSSCTTHPESHRWRVITHYRDGGGSQV